ncbi:MAG: hypothetical protein JWQ04_814 [Pedosphaera sp.]|nr:hypothetical protein [Pedosphaera sp.]
MKTPPFLVGAALLFWGWQTDYILAGAVMALVLESARFTKLRWELSNEDFSRIYTFCSLLFMASAAYAFTNSNGPANLRGLFTNSGFSAQSTVGSLSTKTAVLMIRWLPMVFFLFIAAQTFSNRDGIPLETISFFLRRRRKKARQSGVTLPASRTVNLAYPYLIACLFAASSHPYGNLGFFWGLCGLTAWALWPNRSRRFGSVVWAGTMLAVVGLSYGGQYGLVRLRQTLQQYNPAWLGGLADDGFDPMESRTEIGQIGRIKTSGRIVIRLETKNGAAPPQYLREAGYRLYKSGVWYAGSSKDDFANLTEDPPTSGTWPILPGRTNPATIGIACYLPGGKGLLPLPTDCGMLQQLPVFLNQKNSLGTVHAEGPGLVIFNALYGSRATFDFPPDTNEDLSVPIKEKPALGQVVSELHLDGQDQQKTLETISRYFGTRFNYSLWQEQPKVKDTNTTALSRFLLATHKGHCEYFATATVLLLRQLHIPARYAVGYAVHEPSGKNYVVRQNDAHAWCRVWNHDTQTWENFDTTPGTWVEAERQHRSSLQFLSDAWSRAVFEFSKFRWGQSGLRQYLPWVLTPVLGLLLYQIIFRANRRRARQNQKNNSGGMIWPGLDSDFYQLERELAKRGMIRHSSEPLSDWLRRATTSPAAWSKLNHPLRQILLLHYRYRFDPQGLTAADRETLRREVAVCLSTMALEK